MTEQWIIDGAEGQPIFGTCDIPSGEPGAVVIVSHGFKGYKDYGLTAALSRELCKGGGGGLLVQRFNFSHSGMTNNIETFERPDLFEMDTWNKQVHDLRTVAKAVADGTLRGTGLPQVWLGHSRGGVTTLLAAGRTIPSGVPKPVGLVLVSTPSACCSMSEADRQKFLAEGFIVSPSARTGQQLRIGSAWLQEQLDEPEQHNLVALAANVTCPVLIVHGAADPTVDAKHANRLESAIGSEARVVLVEGADHVFKTPNPAPEDQPISPQLSYLAKETGRFAAEVCTAAST